MDIDAFEELEAITFTTYSATKGNVEVILVDDLRRLLRLSDSDFDTALENAKFSTVVQGINTLCFFTVQDAVGEILTVEAAIITIAMCPPKSELIRQVKEYVNRAVDFCTEVQVLDIDTSE